MSPKNVQIRIQRRQNKIRELTDTSTEMKYQIESALLIEEILKKFIKMLKKFLLNVILNVKNRET